MSGIVNKVKDALHGGSHHHTSTEGSAPEGTFGPHGTRTANAADPRVDSDRDHRGTHGTATTGLGHTTGHNTTGHNTTGHSGFNETGTYGSSGVGATGGPGPAPHTAGPHGNDMLNKVDPRVDSDFDASRNAGLTSNNPQVRHGEGVGAGVGGVGAGLHSGHHHDNHTSTGYGSGVGAGNTGFGTETGARVGAGNTAFGAGSGATGYTGTHGAPEGTYGPHGSRVANAADPRIDSDHDGRANLTGSGPGPAANTAGPHKSDALNKIDPRVDSDLDGSKTLGGNRTYQ